MLPVWAGQVKIGWPMFTVFWSGKEFRMLPVGRAEPHFK